MVGDCQTIPEVGSLCKHEKGAPKRPFPNVASPCPALPGLTRRYSAVPRQAPKEGNHQPWAKDSTAKDLKFCHANSRNPLRGTCNATKSSN
jgi:hypothetical protein